MRLCYYFLSIVICIVTNADKGNKGYIVYCPCMGRFGNQADHFLGSLAFAKGLNRTLVLPPWIEYKYKQPESIQIPFNTYFKVEPLLKYHDVVTMEEFMANEAREKWKPERRIAFCYMGRGGSNESCNAKEGNPFGPFWNKFGVDFVGSEFYQPLHYDVRHSDMATIWNKRYPINEWPVLAFTGAPASFPVQKENRELQKYLIWNESVEVKASNFIKRTLPKGAFVGIHLRNGLDWIRACEHVKQAPILFASPQCFGYRSEYGPVTPESCFPSKDTIVKELRRVLRNQPGAASIFVASDNDFMLEDLKRAFERSNIKVFKYPENDPHVDLAILGRANHFVGNCVSSFSAFVKRERDANGLKSSFWAFPTPLKNSRDEL